MRLRSTLAAVVLASSAVVGSAFAADTYKIDPEHATVIYRVSHFNIGNAYGRFNKPTGTVVLDAADAAKTSFTFEVQTENVDTANAKRDQHLKSPDFFDAKQFPTITFKSTSVKAATPAQAGSTGTEAGSAPAATNNPTAQYEVTGDLTLHGVTKSVTFPITKTGEGDTKMMGVRTGWEAQVDLKRSDFGMQGLQGPVGDTVHLIISFEAVKQ